MRATARAMARSVTLPDREVRRDRRPVRASSSTPWRRPTPTACTIASWPWAATWYPTSALRRAAVRAATPTRSRAATAKRPTVRSSMLPGATPQVRQLAAKRPADWKGEAGNDGDRGVYALRRYLPTALMAINRNAGAIYFIPSENEWYKAAYYNARATARATGRIRHGATRHRATRFP